MSLNRWDKPHFKHETVVPGVVTTEKKARNGRTAWRKAAKAVDERDKRETDDGVETAPTCFVTGKWLQVVNQLDRWTFRDRAHLEARSKSKARRYDAANVISVSRGVHQLIDGHALALLDKRGRPARTVKAIDHVAWNRNLVPKGDEPCRIRKGLAVRKD